MNTSVALILSLSCGVKVGPILRPENWKEHLAENQAAKERVRPLNPGIIAMAQMIQVRMGRGMFRPSFHLGQKYQSHSHSINP